MAGEKRVLKTKREIETETERHNEKTEMSKTKGVTRMIER